MCDKNDKNEIKKQILCSFDEEAIGGLFISQTGHFGPIFVLHVLGERAREESGEEVFHLRFHQRRRGLV